MSNQVAQTIVDQLGGMRRLKVMIGAKNFVAGSKGVTFQFMNGSKNKANRIQITLDDSDTYTVRFFTIRNLKDSTKAEFSGVYWDQLIELFENETAIYLRF